MKKIILAVTLLALAGSQIQQARAGDRGFGVAAGVIGGLAVGTVIGQSIAHQSDYYAPAPVYCPPAPVVYQRPMPVYSYPPAPVCYPQPVFCPPTVVLRPPVLNFGFGFGFGDRHDHFDRRFDRDHRVYEHRDYHDYRGRR